MPLAGEAETVDHRLVAGETKPARARITGLRQRRDRAYLCKAEAQTQYRIDNFAILVEACTKSDRIREI